ncbi:MAG: GTPase RsgA [Spartobacteria bacterium]|nr:GTPase RsgA [Spartobacteria bacterium]
MLNSVQCRLSSPKIVSLEGGRHFNANRIEGFLGMVVSQQITPMIVLNKIDLVDPDVLDDAIAIAGRIAGDQNVFTTSALESKGLDRIDAALPPYSTGIFIGLSGAGKTSLFNELTRQEHAVKAVRAGDRRGRHTTTCRMMEPMAGGAQSIDMPGIREWKPFAYVRSGWILSLLPPVVSGGGVSLSVFRRESCPF